MACLALSLICAVAIGFAEAARGEGEVVVPTVAEMLQKTGAALRAHPHLARVEGIVTLQATNFPWIFVQDATGGVLVQPLDTEKPFAPGDRVMVEGPIGLGSFAPYVAKAKVTVTGKGPLPEPARPGIIALSDGSHFGRYVEVESYVTAVRPGQQETWLTLMGQDQEKSVVVQNAAGLPPPHQLVGARIRARGVDWPTNDRMGFFLRTTDASSIAVLEGPPMFTSQWWGWLVCGLAVAAVMATWLIAWRRRERVYRQLLQSESRLRMQYERSPDAILMFDIGQATFIDCNEAALRLLRCNRNWLVGKTPWELAPPIQPCGTPSKAKAMEVTERVSRSGSLLFEWQHGRADGTDFPAEISVTVLDFDKPQWLCVVRDVTARKDAEAALRTMNQALEKQVEERTAALMNAQEALRDSEQKFRLLVEGASDAMGLLDPNTGQIIHYNMAAVEIFGAASREQFMNAHPWDLSPEFQPDGRRSVEKARECVEEARAHGAHRFEWLHQRFDGTPFNAEVSLTTASMGERQMVIFLLRDITAHKRAQEELQRTLAREKELGDLKSNFVSMVSHEFRTPLGVISSSAQILDRYLPRLDADERREHLHAITGSVKRMAGMMEDVLVLSRVESGRMEFAPSPVSLGELCRRLLDEFASAHGGDVELQVAPDAEAPVPADENLVRHIVHNLLTNARKYSPPDAPAHLALTRDGSDAVLTVRDEGIGIPEKDQARLFEAFHRGGNVGNINGTGLGLVIVRRCCERHGGSVAVFSQEGQGTTFTVRLPVFQSAELPLPHLPK